MLLYLNLKEVKVKHQQTFVLYLLNNFSNLSMTIVSDPTDQTRRFWVLFPSTFIECKTMNSGYD